MKKSGGEILAQAYKESNGETVDVVVDHGTLKGLTFELLLLWGKYMNNPVYYKMWHPEDHIDHELKEEEIKGKGKVKVIHAHERVGKFGASILRALPGDPEKLNFPKVYKPFSCGIMLNPDNEEIGAIYHEYEETEEGVKMRSTFRMPVKVPQEFKEAMAKHSREEMSNLVKILPDLYKKEKAESERK